MTKLWVDFQLPVVMQTTAQPFMLGEQARRICPFVLSVIPTRHGIVELFAYPTFPPQRAKQGIDANVNSTVCRGVLPVTMVRC